MVKLEDLETQTLQNLIFCKTPAGQQEVQTRKLGLGLMPRRLLILIDGQRSVKELSAMLGGQALRTWLQELLTQQCIDTKTPHAPAQAHVKPQAVVVQAPSAATPGNATDTAHFLGMLPPTEQRSAQDLVLARNVLTNTVNTVFQPYTRLTLLEAIAACQTHQQLRAIYPKWHETITSSPFGAKRLGEFQAKLLNVL